MLLLLLIAVVAAIGACIRGAWVLVVMDIPFLAVGRIEWRSACPWSFPRVWLGGLWMNGCPKLQVGSK